MIAMDSTGHYVSPDSSGHFRENVTIKLLCNTSASNPRVERIVWIRNGLNESILGEEDHNLGE